MASDRFVAWAVAPDKPVARRHQAVRRQGCDRRQRHDGRDGASTRQAKVDALYKKAIELGATDEGAPGPRGGGGFYAAYFRDLDGNKLNCFHFG